MADTPPDRIEAKHPNARLVLVGGLIGLALMAAIVALGVVLATDGEDSARGEGPYRGSEPPGRIELPSSRFRATAAAASRALRCEDASCC